MKPTIRHKLCLYSVATLLAACGPAVAQVTTGTPGSLSATTTIDGKQLPPPDPKFGGVIKDDALQSRLALERIDLCRVAEKVRLPLVGVAAYEAVEDAITTRPASA
jgi:hypothetical protein